MANTAYCDSTTEGAVVLIAGIFEDFLVFEEKMYHFCRNTGMVSEPCQRLETINFFRLESVNR